MTGRFVRGLVALVAAGLLAGAAGAAEVAVIARGAAFSVSLAHHVERWLGDGGVSASFGLAPAMDAQLQEAKLAFLVGFDMPTAEELRALRAYRARGGRLVVFYSSSPKLAELMGVRIVGYAQAPYPGAWSRMDFTGDFPEGLPRQIRQTSGVLVRAAAIPGRSRVMATWADRAGKGAGESAWLASAAGFWMTHVLTGDGDETLKSQLVCALVGAVEPKLWNYRDYVAREQRKLRALNGFASRQQPRAGEIHAVWDHSGCGLYPGNWARTFQALQAAHVTDLYVNVAGAGFAHFPSKVLPKSKTFEEEGDQLSACLKAAAGTGVRVHAWILCFTAARASKETREAFRVRGWLLKSRSGALTEYLDPSNAKVRDYVLRAVDDVVSRYAVSGIHLDFVRWGDGTAKPKDASAQVTAFVGEVRRRVKGPCELSAAVYGGYPECVATVGQDWGTWLNRKLVDRIVPMDYASNRAEFEKLLAAQAAFRNAKGKIVIGLGVTANESRLNARQVIEQAVLVRKYGFAGVALFDLDAFLERRVLPYLGAGLW